MKTLSHRNIIIFSSIDWETHRQLHHELCDFLIKRNNRILFVENTGSRNLRIKDLPRVKSRIVNFFKSKGGFRMKNQKLSIYTPIFIPFHFNFFVKKINNFFISNAIINWSNHFYFHNPIIINFVPNPITYSLTKNINSSSRIYYMADDMSSNRASSIKIENKIIEESDIIFYTSLNLKKKIKDKNKSYYLPNGVNLNIFKNSYKKNRKINNKKIKIGYVGAIRDILNEKLILKISEKFPNDKIFLVGPILHKFKKILEKENIVFMGHQSHKKIPKILKEFDIAIIPYKINYFTNSINPLKLYEYVSAGLPVVSTNLKSLNFIKDKKKYSIHISKNENKFLENILNLKQNYKFTNKNYSKKFLEDNSWHNRFAQLEKQILEKEFEINNSNKKIINRIKEFYNTKKIKFFKHISIIFLIGIFIFYSSISNFIYDKFTSNHSSILDNKIVIIFSGFGHRKYHNLDYLNRAKDILHYQQKYNFDEIIIIGRSAKFDEGELILDIFQAEFSKQVFLISDKGSSFNNILELKSFLEMNFNNIKNINIIASPIYTQRINLLIKKNLPTYQANFLPPSQIYIEEKKLNYFSLFYEMFATVYYKLKNYI